ncbi:hypothetical protein [Thioclava pacifica]|uniref:Uncharacterized protein n=1 Tax=Thioclava pacifica DSM 10166 TaxID=1353537 RepID=A0A074JF02_9RHOB|nr:hypothetical protein [Thioclava pacifica]KEO54123.1 hypothetical protein TP2_04175 [Thioclava pacifica DSM 10166]
MTVQIPQTQQDRIFQQYLNLQNKVAQVAEKEHKAQLRRRRYVLDAFGKWLDKAPRSEVEAFLKALSEASCAADSKRIADYLAKLPPEPEATTPASPPAPRASTTEKPQERPADPKSN